VSQYQKGKTSLDFTEARNSEWQRHQLGHMQVCNSLQTDNHANTPPLIFTISFLLPNQQRYSASEVRPYGAIQMRLLLLLLFIYLVVRDIGVGGRSLVL